MKSLQFGSTTTAATTRRAQLMLLLFLIFGVLHPAFAQSIITNGLVAYYPLNGNADDASGNGNNGVVHGTLTTSSNQVGTPNAAVSFPSSFITVTPTPFNVNSDWTISLWCLIDNGNSAANNMVSTGSDDSGGVDIRWYGTSIGQPSWELISGNNGIPPLSGILSSPTNNPYSWNMVTCTRKGNFFELFLNSTLIGSNTLFTPATDQGHLVIGTGDYPLNGVLSDVLIYNRALSFNEIAQIYNIESGQPTPAITTDVSNTSLVIGSNATFQVSVSGSSPFTYQWYWTNNNPSQVAQAYAQTIFGFVYGVVVTNGGFGYGNVPNVTFVGGGGTAQGYASVSNGVVTAITVTNSSSGFSKVPAVVVDPPNGALYGQTNITLTISNVNSGNLGGYYVVVSNAYGSVTSSIGNVTLLYPPTIVSNPISVNLSLHGSNTLSVSASGTSPLSYQWTFNTTNITGATGTNYSITNFAQTNIGNFAAVVSNPYGVVTSTLASVQMIPSLTIPFTGSIGLWGQPTTLSVGAVGSGMLNYQWYFNGVPISGATSNTYTLPSAQFTNAGLYSVVASNSYGSVSNTACQLVVNPANVSLATTPTVVIQGTVGYNYAIQSTTDLGNTNAWIVETNITLAQPIQNWYDASVDTSKSIIPKKFYRVIAGQ